MMKVKKIDENDAIRLFDMFKNTNSAIKKEVYQYNLKLAAQYLFETVAEENFRNYLHPFIKKDVNQLSDKNFQRLILKIKHQKNFFKFINKLAKLFEEDKRIL